MKTHWLYSLFLIVTTLTVFAAEVAAEPPVVRELPLDQETDLTVNGYPAEGPYILIWIPGYSTPAATIEKMARQLNQLDVELWYADFLEARFLPKTASSIYKIPEQDILQLIKSVPVNPARKLFILAENRAVIPTLLALRQYQQSPVHNINFGGIIMNTPYFYVETPDPGTKARLMPIVKSTNLPIFIFQPKNNPRFWQLKETIPALENGGSDVFIQVLQNIRGRFLFRPDSTAEEERITQIFGQHIVKAIKHLETINQKPRQLATQSISAIRAAGGKKNRFLGKYKGDPQPPPLILNNLSGKQFNLKDFKQQVVLVNFWASWCPPCVEEMPSLQRLSNKLSGRSFTILGVNIAEEESTVQKFLSERVNIGFPVLLDKEGEIMRQWNVMAFPTSFVIDKRGKIRYALFGSIDWDTPEILKKIQSLLNE